MGSLRAISSRLERLTVERDSFRKAVDEAFRRADLDGNGVVAPREVAAMSDTMFDLVEKELADYGIEFKRPTTEQVRQFLDTADKNEDYVLDRDEFFEFYRQVVKYCAVVAESRGFARKFLPKMLMGFLAVYAVQTVGPGIPSVGPIIAPALRCLPAFIIGPLLGFLFALQQGDGNDAKLQKRLFSQERSKKDGAGTSSQAQ